VSESRVMVMVMMVVRWRVTMLGAPGGDNFDRLCPWAGVDLCVTKAKTW